MTILSLTADSKSHTLTLTLTLTFTVVFAVSAASSGISLAEPVQGTIYNQCACACNGSRGGNIDTYNNDAGVDCGAYNGHVCTYVNPDGSTYQGTLQWCTPYKPGGTRAGMLLPRIGLRAPAIMSRGVEGENPPPASEMQEPLVPSERLGNVMMNCECDQGKGSCSVTSTDGRTSICEKGHNDTCTGTCRYPKGTISGFREAPSTP